ncbi:class I SAM-dependent methyltransferase [Xylanibacillus composti]|uniref:Methyltransferase domain-containing protein n=1 Tax=Xylanibacillus composti TaxID=1572762 RepID=A0A8J4H1X4_9BACL|nr:class I SAM-dependent methyltransferase [Xylanibacillus composti]MDT9726221.1 class I SAM-dependent methyltransferase [Xylanibacillus composti]GIQ68071.1 hypothetical protein XYCOK13_08950 [Xylanibacillus composti]
MSISIAVGASDVLAEIAGNDIPMGAAIAYGVTILLLISGLLSIVGYTVWNGISPMPSSKAARVAVAGEVDRLIRAGALSEGDVIVDAGSGWGHLAFYLARRFPQLSVVGVENSLLPLAVSRLARGLTVSTNVAFRRGDLYQQDYTEAKLVVCYLYPGAMDRMRRTIHAARVGTGARECLLISVGFAFRGVPAERTTACRDMYRTPIYLYRLIAMAGMEQENKSNPC